MNSLALRIPELIKSTGNFAYFCSFSDENRIHGEETLFLGRDFKTGTDPTPLDGLQNEIPVIVSFSMVHSIWNFRNTKESYPRLVYFHPDSTEKGEYIRDKPFTGNPFSGDSTDKELEGKIRKMIRSIREGEMLQIVLSREFGPLDVDPVERFFSFLSNDRSMYVFFYRIGPYMVLGSSPENLITRSGRRVMIEPIAGTRKISMDPVSNLDMEKELLSDRKELQEHRMLVDLARNDLGKVSLHGSVQVTSSMRIRRFSSVMHIVSTVESTLREDVKNSELLKAVFPAGTVSGAPKERAIGHILELEGDERGPYAGAVGIASRDSMTLALAIRTLYTKDGEIYTRAGAGIVKDSIPEREMMEIFMKAFTASGGELCGTVDH